MKTKVKVNDHPSCAFPIKIKLKIETPEELRDFLAVNAVLSRSSDFTLDCDPYEYDDNIQESAKEHRIAKFIDGMLSHEQYENLSYILDDHDESVV